MVNYSDVLKWYDDYHQNAIATANEQKQELGNIRELLHPNRSKPGFITLCKSGKTLANQLNEPNWYLLFEVEYTNALIENTANSKEQLDLAIRLFAEMSKEQYKNCPGLIYPHFRLIQQYVEYDIPGYANDILESIDYCLDNVPLTQLLHINLVRYQVDTYIALEEWETALKFAGVYHDLAQSDPYHRVESALVLCHIYYRIKDEETLKIYLKNAENTLQEHQNLSHKLMVLYWRGVLLSRENLPYSASVKLQQQIDIIKIQHRMFLEPQLSNVNFIDSVERKHGNIGFTYEDSLPFIYESNASIYYRALMTLRKYYIYKNVSWFSRNFDMVTYAGVKFNKNPIIRGFVSILYYPYTIIPKPRDHQSCLLLLFGVVALFFTFWFLLFGALLRLFISPERDMKKIIQKILRDSPSLSIFEERLQKIDADTGYIP